MDEDQPSQTDIGKQSVEEKEKWHTSLTRVTPLSKYVALALFVVLPFVGFWLGMEYSAQENESAALTETVNDEILFSFVQLGGECGQMVCKNTMTVLRDGRWKFEDESNPFVEGTIGNEDMRTLTEMIEQTQFHEIQKKKNSSCSETYNGYRTIYSFYLADPLRVESVDMCEIDINQKIPLVDYVTNRVAPLPFVGFGLGVEHGREDVISLDSKSVPESVLVTDNR